MNAVISNYNPGAMLALATSSTTVTVIGARAGMSAYATPVSDIGSNFYWEAFVSANDTVTIKVGCLVAGTPNVVNWSVRVIP